MATGDVADFQSRLKVILPARWFSDTAPVLDTLLAGFAAQWSVTWANVGFAQLQTRIATATGPFLDMAALDYVRGKIVRRPGEMDASFSARIRAEIVRPRATRAALVQALTDLTGRAPIVFEPARPADTGGYGFLGMTAGSGLAYGGSGVAGAGGWGSLALPFQAFVTAYRATGGGIAAVGGYYTGSGWAGGGYSTGALEWGALSMSLGQITDSDIYAAVANVIPAGAEAWVAITN